MTKKNLKTGMRVKMRNDELYLVLKDCETERHRHQILFFANMNGCGFMLGEGYDNNLMRTGGGDDYDIVEIFTTENGYCGGDILDKTSLKSIWKREHEFTYEGFINSEFVVNCRTQEDANMFLAYLTGKGITWSNEDALLGELDIWEQYKEETCYSYWRIANGIEYGTLSSYKNKNIITFTKEMLCG